MIEMLITVIVFLCGWIVGISYNGINIYHEGKPTPKEKGEPVYNEDYTAELPPEIRQYYEQHNGMNKF